MPSRVKKPILWSTSIAVGLVLLLMFVGPAIEYKQVDIWICPVTGSTKIQVTWFGHFSHDKRTTTALEQWLKRKEPSFEPQWQHTSTDTYYIFAASYLCGETPVISRLTPILDGVVSKFSDERIAGLVEVLRHGSRDEQIEAVQRISDEYAAN